MKKETRLEIISSYKKGLNISKIKKKFNITATEVYKVIKAPQ